MKNYKVQSLQSLRKEMKAVSRGEMSAPADAAQPSVNSVEALVRLLTPENRKLLALVRYGKPALDWSQCEAVESVPGKVSGAWVFRGTRIPVATVFENLEDGLGIDEIVRMFDGLTREQAREQVRAVLDFAAQSLIPTPAH